MGIRWEDGEPVKCCLDSPDRWQTQAAERVTVELAVDQTVTVQQQVLLFSYLCVPVLLQVLSSLWVSVVSAMALMVALATEDLHAKRT